VAVSSVSPELLELLRVAVRRLRGLRLCEEGCEEARLTHLIIGAQRRTLKASFLHSGTAYAASVPVTFRSQVAFRSALVVALIFSHAIQQIAP
jgi:hypothetical protein